MAATSADECVNIPPTGTWPPLVCGDGKARIVSAAGPACVRADSLSFGDVREPLDLSSGWLQTVNWYRQASGLPPVTENPAWTESIRKHLEYLTLTPQSLLVGEFANEHYENPESPHFSADGATAGLSSNLSTGSIDERSAIDGWMAAPFHAMGILRRGTTQVAFARQADGQRRAGLDVIRGNTWVPPTGPVVFPGYGSSIHMRHFRGESPNPLESCGYASAGLPLFAMLASRPAEGTSAVLTDDSGRIVPSCTVTEHNYISSDAAYGPTGLSILAGEHAVMVIPRDPLTAPWYEVSIRQPGRADLNWWFSVADPGDEVVKPTVSQQCEIGVTIDMRSGALGIGTPGDDVIVGTNGSDRIDGMGGDDVVCSHGGSDVITLGSGHNLLEAGSGADQIAVGDGQNNIWAGSGHDRVVSGNGDDLIYAGGGHDVVFAGGGTNEIFGQGGADNLSGGRGQDTIYGGPGYDTLRGYGSADFLNAGGGNDTVYGGGGPDKIFGKTGDDRLYGEAGNDQIYGASGDDEIYGGPGSDRMQGAAGRDRMEGNAGNDTLFGQADNDIMLGQDGNDTLYAAAGDDSLDGGAGKDNLQAGGGDDTLIGGPGADILYGQAGVNTLDGGPEVDQCFAGGAGSTVSAC